jgi:predicted outer membrane protein
MKRSLFVVALCLLTSGALAAQESTSAEGVSPEQHFVTKATQSSLAEVEMGRLAQKRSKDPAVQKFAAQMVKDHEKAREDLTTLAKSKNLTVSTQLDGEHSTIMHRLGTKPPSEFDSEYGKQMIEAHEKAVTLYSDAAALKDKDLVAYAKKALPTIQQHQQMAATLPAKMPVRREATLTTDPLSADPASSADPAPAMDPETETAVPR